jgi:hypothetical protein
MPQRRRWTRPRKWKLAVIETQGGTGSSLTFFSPPPKEIIKISATDFNNKRKLPKITIIQHKQRLAKVT